MTDATTTCPPCPWCGAHGKRCDHAITCHPPYTLWDCKSYHMDGLDPVQSSECCVREQNIALRQHLVAVCEERKRSVKFLGELGDAIDTAEAYLESIKKDLTA